MTTLSGAQFPVVGLLRLGIGVVAGVVGADAAVTAVGAGIGLSCADVRGEPEDPSDWYDAGVNTWVEELKAETVLPGIRTLLTVPTASPFNFLFKKVPRRCPAGPSQDHPHRCHNSPEQASLLASALVQVHRL